MCSLHTKLVFSACASSDCLYRVVICGVKYKLWNIHFKSGLINKVKKKFYKSLNESFVISIVVFVFQPPQPFSNWLRNAFRWVFLRQVIH
jgi:hypothetical protein